MNKYCVDLKLTSDVFTNKDYYYHLRLGRHVNVDNKMFNRELIEIFDSLGLRITYSESFFRTTMNSKIYAVHKDAPGSNDAAKINWVFGGEDSLMDWYRPIRNSTTDTNSIAENGIEYAAFDLKDVELVHQQRVGCPSIIQSGIPHGVTLGKRPRHCIAIFVKYKNSKEYISFDEALEIFKDFI